MSRTSTSPHTGLDVPGIVERPGALGEGLCALIERLYPICRSITGAGLRETLSIIGEHVPLQIHEVSSGTQVLDWVVPPEWNVRDAFVKNKAGERVIDFGVSNLHVVNYSTPIHETMSLDELRPHLHALADRPHLIPYRTSYYSESWGFCLSQHQLDLLADGEYEVLIDSTLAPGSLTYGEFVVPGELSDEILISTHVCHPSLCDDNLSGIAVSALLAEALSAIKPRYTFRFLYAPGTIGAITWLAKNRDQATKVAAGLTLTCLGDDYPFTYKRTERGDTAIDRAAEYVLEHSSAGGGVIDFFPYGYDERQYNSPGFRIPVGSLLRGRHGEFPEYHTSGDNLDFISESRLVESFDTLNEIVDVVDRNRILTNTEPYGEPQLGSRGLYGALGGTKIPEAQLAMLWVLNQSDGSRDLLDISLRSGISFDSIAATADVLMRHGLLRDATGPHIRSPSGQPDQ
jgi:aminopeptidase-like protein